MIYFTGLTVSLSVMLSLVFILLFLESWLVSKEDVSITINNDPDKSIKSSTGSSLLSCFIDNKILIPSACGGQGACGMCKCVVTKGGLDVLPTELAHLSRKEKKDNVRLTCQLKVKQDLSVEIPPEIFSIKKYHGVVVSNENVATFIKHLVLKLDEGEAVDFKAGSYMQIDVPPYELLYNEFDVNEEYSPVWDQFGFFSLKSVSKEPVFRAYSLANPPYEKNILTFTIRVATPPPGKKDIPPGIGSSYAFNLKKGDRVTLSGPYGDFFVKETGREMCFIGGGAGMAPMRSHILDQLEGIKTDRTVTFWYGARSLQEMFFDEEFKGLNEKHTNFSYNVALSDPQPEDNWKKLTGFIHQCLYDNYLKSHEDPTEIEYYLCGPPPMIDAVINMIDSLGVEPEMIHYDKF